MIVARGHLASTGPDPSGLRPSGAAYDQVRRGWCPQEPEKPRNQRNPEEEVPWSVEGTPPESPLSHWSPDWG
ncbi:hypothetical protein GCM10023317_68030 [Actinopolymorpha pittospori]